MWYFITAIVFAAVGAAAGYYTCVKLTASHLADIALSQQKDQP